MSGTRSTMPEPNSSPRTPHLLVPWPARTLRPKPPRPARGPDLADRSADRPGHVSRLVGGLEQARDEAVDIRSEIPEPYRADGFAVRIEAAAGHALKLEALDSSGLTLMSVHPGADQRPEDALV
ncbi:hypothetical protein ACIP68_36380 [Streptomyces griseoviridis]